MTASVIKRELVTGIVAGALFLGVGGRMVMRVVAIAEGRVPTWTPEGVVAVTLFGTGFGILGAVIHLLLLKFIPARKALRESLFFVALVLITLRGLNGQMVPAAGLFVVAMVLYWAAFTYFTSRRSEVRGSPDSETVFFTA
jgi:hypothetical protein